MTYHDALDCFSAVIAQAKLADKLSGMLDGVRTVSESAVSTLDRVLRERRELVELLRELGIRNREPFDHAFKESGGPVSALREHMKLGLGAPVLATVQPDDRDDTKERFAQMEMR